MTTYLGKSCSFCLPRVPFVYCCQFMYLVISLLVLRAGYGIWLYQFLIIAYLFSFRKEKGHIILDREHVISEIENEPKIIEWIGKRGTQDRESREWQPQTLNSKQSRTMRGVQIQSKKILFFRGDTVRSGLTKIHPKPDELSALSRGKPRRKRKK